MRNTRKKIKPYPGDTKKVFWRSGTCSRTFVYLLNREFGFSSETEERAADPLAGGIMQKGHQCGMIWGAALAVGAESSRRHNDRGRAIGVAITASQHLMNSFSAMTSSVNCREITGADFSSKYETLKHILLKSRFCFNLAEQWAPEAIQSATKGLRSRLADPDQQPVSCASEVAQKMGASDEEMVRVAGFAGGLGLSGNGCGALSAAIWMNTLAWHRKQTASNRIKATLNAFNAATGGEMRCHKITGQRFQAIDEHTEFINKGGCRELIDTLSRS